MSVSGLVVLKLKTWGSSKNGNDVLIISKGRYGEKIEQLGPLKDCSPRLFALEQHKDCLVADRWVLEEDVWQDEAQDDK
ncbi:hypothetical protein Tco_0731334 [Tanacetum coccineum]